jgi:hypothetical protein
VTLDRHVAGSRDSGTGEKMSTFGTYPATNRTERTGKVFMVDQGMRTCFVCEQEFSRQEAAEHANLACYPAEYDGGPVRSQNANR